MHKKTNLIISSNVHFVPLAEVITYVLLAYNTVGCVDFTGAGGGHMEPPSRRGPPMDYGYDDYNAPPERPPYDSYGPPRGGPGPAPPGPSRYPHSRDPVSLLTNCYVGSTAQAVILSVSYQLLSGYRPGLVYCSRI